MHGFALHSPLRPLIETVGLQFPVLVGLLIAIAEIGVGIGALTGIGFDLPPSAAWPYRCSSG